MPVPDLLPRLQRASTARNAGPVIIHFDAWEPDKPELGQSLLYVNNVRPGALGYEPIPTPLKSFGGVGETVIGAASARGLMDNQAYIYAGTKTKLWKASGRQFTDVTRATGGAYATGDTDNFNFSFFQGDILATNYADAVQGAPVDPSTAFSDWITSTAKPRARQIGVISDFVFLGDVTDATEGTHPNRVWWSGRANSKTFDPDATTQSDWNDFSTGGQVKRIVGGREYGYIFLRDQLWRAEYVGPPVIFDFYPIDEELGTPVANSVFAVGRKVFFWSEQGFQMLEGATPRAIGHDKVDDFFSSSFNVINAHNLSVTFDPFSKTVVWAYPDKNSPLGLPNRVIVYGWERDRWGWGTMDMDWVFDSRIQSYSLEDLAQFYPSDPPNRPPPNPTNTTAGIDTPGMPSLDDPQWQGGERVMSGFDRHHDLVTFTGPPFQAEFETGDSQFFPGHTANVVRGRPITDTQVCTVASLGRSNLHTVPTFGQPQTMQDNGVVHFRNNRRGRYHRFKIVIPEATQWRWCNGFEAEVVVEKGVWR